MSRMRFRLRTIMIAIAAVAAVLGGVCALERAGIEVWAGIEGRDLVVVISEHLRDPRYSWSRSHYHFIPVKGVLCFVAAAIGLLALPICQRILRRRRSQSSASAKRQVRSTDSTESGEAERV